MNSNTRKTIIKAILDINLTVIFKKIVNFFYNTERNTHTMDASTKGRFRDYIYNLNQHKLNELFDRLNIYPKQMIRKL